MSVLFTIVFFVVLAMWGLAAYNRLLRLRSQIKSAWKQLDAAPQEGNADRQRQTYNDLAIKYNAALTVFPGNVIAGLAGFRPAQQLPLKS